MTATVGSSPVRWAAGVRREDAGTPWNWQPDRLALNTPTSTRIIQLGTREKDFMPSPLEVERAQAAR